MVTWMEVGEMMEYEKKMEAIKLIAETLNPIPLRELANQLNEMARQKDIKPKPNKIEKREVVWTSEQREVWLAEVADKKQN